MPRTRRKWHSEDRMHVANRLHAKNVSAGTKPPWRCPTWLLNDASVQSYLRTYANDLGRPIKVLCFANFCITGRKQARVLYFMKRRWLELRDINGRRAFELVGSVNDA